MPTPAKTSDEGILAAARTLLERGGAAALTLGDVAAAVGVKTPSLYKRFADRAALLSRLEQQGFEELGQALRSAAEAPQPFHAMSRAYRRFVLGAPHLYALMMDSSATRSADSEQWRRAAVAPVLQVLGAAVGPERSLAAARAVTAFLHGFASMEAAGAFRLGGNLEADFEAALAMVLRGVLGT